VSLGVIRAQRGIVELPPALVIINSGWRKSIYFAADRAEVVGQGTVSLYCAKGRGAVRPDVLRSGDKYDFAECRKR
jgi:hypothetical protein